MNRAGIRRHLWVVAEALCLLAFMGYRIGAAVSSSPAVWQDSLGYKAVAAHGLLSSQLWAGARSPLAPLLMKLTGSFDAYGVLQGVLGALAWAFAAYTASRLVRASWRKPLVTAVVLGFAATPLVVIWDGSALSESPSLSVLALLWACGIWLVRRFTWPRFVALALCAIAYCGLRDADAITTGVVGLVLTGTAFFRVIRGTGVEPAGGRLRLRENWRRARHPAAVGVMLLAIALVSEGAAASSHRTPKVEDAFAVRIFPYPDRVAWFESQGMPQAQDVRLMALATRPAPGMAPVVKPDLDDPRWRALATWFRQDGQSEYDLFLLFHPGYVLTAPFASPPLTFNDFAGNVFGYTPSGYALAPWLGGLLAPNRFVEWALAELALVVAVRRRVWRLPWWRFTVFFAGLGLVSMLLAWHGEGMEATRHTVEGNVEVRLSVLLLLTIGLLCGRRHRRHDAADMAEAQGARPEPSRAEATEDPVPTGAQAARTAGGLPVTDDYWSQRV